MRFLVFVCVIFMLFSNNANAEAGDILINNENKIIKLDKPFELKENYILTISRLKDKPTSVLISLSKNNKKVCPDKPEYVGYSYLYICLNKKTNKKLLRFKLGNFVGDDSIRITNIFQYSDGSFVVTQTPVKTATPTPTPTPTKTVIQTTSKPTKYKTMGELEKWEFVKGWILKADSISPESKKACFLLFKNGNKLDEKCLSETMTYKYKDVISVKIDSVFTLHGTNFVRLKDVYVNQDYAVKVSNSKNESKLRIYIINFMLYILLVIVPTYLLIKYGSKMYKLGESFDNIKRKIRELIYRIF